MLETIRTILDKWKEGDPRRKKIKCDYIGRNAVGLAYLDPENKRRFEMTIYNDVYYGSTSVSVPTCRTCLNNFVITFNKGSEDYPFSNVPEEYREKNISIEGCFSNSDFPEPDLDFVSLIKSLDVEIPNGYTIMVKLDTQSFFDRFSKIEILT